MTERKPPQIFFTVAESLFVAAPRFASHSLLKSRSEIRVDLTESSYGGRARKSSGLDSHRLGGLRVAPLAALLRLEAHERAEAAEGLHHGVLLRPNEEGGAAGGKRGRKRKKGGQRRRRNRVREKDAIK